MKLWTSQASFFATIITSQAMFEYGANIQTNASRLRIFATIIAYPLLLVMRFWKKIFSPVYNCREKDYNENILSKRSKNFYNPQRGNAFSRLYQWKGQTVWAI